MMGRLLAHIAAWSAGALYYAGQKGEPQPRLWFDVPWAAGVIVTGHRLVRDTKEVTLWLVGGVIFVAGFFIHFPAVVLGIYKIPKYGASQEVKKSVKQFEWIAKAMSFAGVVLMLISTVRSFRRN